MRRLPRQNPADELRRGMLALDGLVLGLSKCDGRALASEPDAAKWIAVVGAAISTLRALRRELDGSLAGVDCDGGRGVVASWSLQQRRMLRYLLDHGEATTLELLKLVAPQPTMGQRASVSRSLRRLQTAGIIERDGRRVTIAERSRELVEDHVEKIQN